MVDARALEAVVGILTGAEASHFFFGRLPSRMTTRKFTDAQDQTQNKIALTESVIMGLLLAVVVGCLMRSVWVFLMAMVIMSCLAVLYMNDLYKWW